MTSKIEADSEQADSSCREGVGSGGIQPKKKKDHKQRHHCGDCEKGSE